MEPLEERRMLAAGDLDTTFGGDGWVTTEFLHRNPNDHGRSVAVQADGKIIVAGHSYVGSSGDLDFALARFNTDGSLDTSFSGDGLVTTSFPDDVSVDDDRAYDVAIQADGKIVVVGTSNGDFAVARYHSNGSLDTSFSSDGKVVTGFGTSSGIVDEARSVAVQPDGKIVVVGFSNSDFAIVRYTSNGSLDTLFSSDGKQTTAISVNHDEIRSVAVQADGKIVVAGSGHNGTNMDFAVARYLANGTLDTSFSTDGWLTTAIGAGNDEATGLVVQADGKIVVAGYADIGAGNDDFAVVRYNSDGSLDTGFDVDGLQTTNINGDDFGRDVVLQADGRIVVVGSAGGTSSPTFGLVRYNTDGSLDTDFSGDGKQTTTFFQSSHVAYGVAVQSDGKIIAAGEVGGSAPDFGLARYNADGTLDTGFDVDGLKTVNFPPIESSEWASAVAVQADGKIVAAGVSYDGSSYDSALARYNSDGSLDISFGGDGKVTTDAAPGAAAVAIQPDGKIIAGGGQYVTRYHADGSLDTSFDGDGLALVNLGQFGDIRAVALQSDGRILVAGSARVGQYFDFALARLNADGSLDSTFDGDGRVLTSIGAFDDEIEAIALDANGRIVVAGSSNNGSNRDFAVARYNANGSLDTSFSGDGMLTTQFSSPYVWEQASGVVVQADGKIVVGGDNQVQFAAVRYNSDGSLDTSFSDDGYVLTTVATPPGSGTLNAHAHSVALQPNGKILVAGQAIWNIRTFGLVRYNPDGTLDTSFSGDGKLTSLIQNGDEAYAVAIQGDGKIVAAGYSFGDFALARFEGDFLHGDYNRDTSVDAADYVLWRKMLGTASPSVYSGADGDGDMSVDQDDRGVWAEHFGEPANGVGSGEGGAGSAAASVAEQGVSGGVVDAASDATSISAAEPQLLSASGFFDAGHSLASPRQETLALRGELAEPTALANGAAMYRDDALVAWLASRDDGRQIEVAAVGALASDDNGRVNQAIETLEAALVALCAE